MRHENIHTNVSNSSARGSLKKEKNVEKISIEESHPYYSLRFHAVYTQMHVVEIIKEGEKSLHAICFYAWKIKTHVIIFYDSKFTVKTDCSN